MAGQDHSIKYIDTRPIFFPRLTRYPGGKTLPGGDGIIKVTDGEYKTLMKMKNGPNPCFEDVKEPRRRAASQEEI
jgi:hypothetical protein